MKARSLVLLLPLAIALALFVFLSRKQPQETSGAQRPTLTPSGQHTVVLISLDGFRGDYLNAADTPMLWKRLPQAAYSRQLIPPFPSLTFPSHVTLATGQAVSGHGIPSNSFYDESLGEELRFPGDASLLKAEPIWTTATRQGLRVLSYDWPLSHSQSGPHAAAYFETEFNRSLSDADRVGRVLDLWEQDPRRSKDDLPLRLVTSYAKEADSVGHRAGPDAAETRDAVREVDALIDRAIERAIRIFDSTRQEGAQLYIIFAADHGMDSITHFVNIDRLLGAELAEKVIASTSGNLANIHVRHSSPDPPDALLGAVDLAFAGADYARLFTPETLPAQWSYPSEGRTGQRIAVLNRGHTFDRSSTQPVTASSPERSPRGMHGYPPDEVAEMAGTLFILRHPAPLEQSGDLGRVSATQIHSTICEILGIATAPGADTRTVFDQAKQTLPHQGL